MYRFQCIALTMLLISLPLGFLPTANAQIAPSPNYVHAPDMRHLLHWTHFPILVYITPGELATKERNDATRAGFDEWVHATRGFVKYQITTTPALANVIVTYLPDSSVPGKDGATGNTRLNYFSTGLERAQMVLATAGAAPIDLQATAAHEFGHALGIDGHSDDPGDIMYPTLHQTLAGGGLPPPIHRITLRDLNTLKACYPTLTVEKPQ